MSLPVPPPPDFDPAEEELPAFPRAVRILAYQFRCLLHKLSPTGALCAWMQWCARLSVTILIPAAIILPIAFIVLFCLAALVKLLVEILTGILTALALIAGGILLLGVFGRR